MVGEIVDVDFADFFQKSITKGDTPVSCANDAIKEEIMNAKRSDVLRAVITINSPITIVEVEKIDEKWFLNQIS